jgi:hypothetical protein
MVWQGIAWQKLVLQEMAGDLIIKHGMTWQLIAWQKMAGDPIIKHGVAWLEMV